MIATISIKNRGTQIQVKTRAESEVTQREKANSRDHGDSEWKLT